MKEYKNILIVRTDRIGDVVLTTPVIQVLRKKFPRARISILVAPATRELVEGNPYLDEVLLDERKGAHQGLPGFIKLAGALRRKNFDTVFIFHTKRRTNLLCFLAGIPERIGYANNKFGFLLTRPLPDFRHSGQKHESEYCLDVLRAVDIEPDGMPEFNLPLQKPAEDWAENFIRSRNISARKLVAIHPGASDPAKQWPAHRFAELITVLKERYSSECVIIGAANIQEEAAAISAKVNFPVIDLTGKSTVSQTASLLKRCRLLVSNDSGPVHMADALGTPVVSIFTRNQPGINPERWKPLGKNSRTVVTPFKGEMSFTRHGAASAEYLDLIPATQVLEAVDALFKLC